MTNVDSAESKNFKKFLRLIWNQRSSASARYFGEVAFWLILSFSIATYFFPAMWAKTNYDLRGFWIVVPGGGWAILRGIYVLWKYDS